MARLVVALVLISSVIGMLAQLELCAAGKSFSLPALPVRELDETISGWIRNSRIEERAGFVKSLMETASAQSNGRNVMVYNIGQNYNSNLMGVEYFKSVHEHDTHFGIWVFKCGLFENQGHRGYDNWAYSGHWTNFNNGNSVRFLDQDCPDPAYKQ